MADLPEAPPSHFARSDPKRCALARRFSNKDEQIAGLKTSCTRLSEELIRARSNSSAVCLDLCKILEFVGRLRAYLHAEQTSCSSSSSSHLARMRSRQRGASRRTSTTSNASGRLTDVLPRIDWTDVEKIAQRRNFEFPEHPPESPQTLAAKLNIFTSADGSPLPHATLPPRKVASAEIKLNTSHGPSKTISSPRLNVVGDIDKSEVLASKNQQLKNANSVGQETQSVAADSQPGRSRRKFRSTYSTRIRERKSGNSRSSTNQPAASPASKSSPQFLQTHPEAEAVESQSSDRESNVDTPIECRSSSPHVREKNTPEKVDANDPDAEGAWTFGSNVHNTQDDTILSSQSSVHSSATSFSKPSVATKKSRNTGSQRNARSDKQCIETASLSAACADSQSKPKVSRESVSSAQGLVTRHHRAAAGTRKKGRTDTPKTPQQASSSGLQTTHKSKLFVKSISDSRLILSTNRKRRFWFKSAKKFVIVLSSIPLTVDPKSRITHKNSRKRKSSQSRSTSRSLNVKHVENVPKSSSDIESDGPTSSAHAPHQLSKKSKRARNRCRRSSMGQISLEVPENELPYLQEPAFYPQPREPQARESSRISSATTCKSTKSSLPRSQSDAGISSSAARHVAVKRPPKKYTVRSKSRKLSIDQTPASSPAENDSREVNNASSRASMQEKIRRRGSMSKSVLESLPLSCADVDNIQGDSDAPLVTAPNKSFRTSNAVGKRSGSVCDTDPLGYVSPNPVPKKRAKTTGKKKRAWSRTSKSQTKVVHDVTQSRAAGHGGGQSVHTSGVDSLKTPSPGKVETQTLSPTSKQRFRHTSPASSSPDIDSDVATARNNRDRCRKNVFDFGSHGDELEPDDALF